MNSWIDVKDFTVTIHYFTGIFTFAVFRHFIQATCLYYPMSKTTPAVTISIPVYNAEQYIFWAIQSVLQQTFTDFELIIINDGSTDRSDGIIRSFKDERIIYLNDGKNKGLVARLNQGVQMARAPFFARMDADDIMFVSRIEQQFNCMEQSGADLVYGEAVSINNNNEILGYKTAVDIQTKEDILNGNVPIHPTIMARTAFLRPNPYDAAFSQMEDYELWYRIIEKASFKRLPEPLIFYREDSTPNSAKYKKMYKSMKRFVKRYSLSARKIFDNRIRYISYKFLEKIGKEAALLRRRYKELPADKLLYFQSEIYKQTNHNDSI